MEWRIRDLSSKYNNRYTIEYVSKVFEKEGYILLSREYKNPHTKLNYICPKGHSHSISWTKWLHANRRCVYCSKRPPISFDKINNAFEKEGYILLSKSYANRKKLRYVCTNGHTGSITWDNWYYNDHRCLECSNNIPPKFDDIKSSFESEGYILLCKKYVNANTKLNYICPLGHKSSVRWRHWNNGVRCRKCRSIEFSAEGHPNWQGGIANLPYCFNWTKAYKNEIKQRDSYKCQNPYCYGGCKRLSVHHIDYTKTICGPDNLITLCTGCNSRANKDREWHTEWYRAILTKKYGYKYE